MCKGDDDDAVVIGNGFGKTGKDANDGLRNDGDFWFSGSAEGTKLSVIQ
jgi:hypothetical protein